MAEHYWCELWYRRRLRSSNLENLSENEGAISGGKCFDTKLKLFTIDEGNREIKFENGISEFSLLKRMSYKVTNVPFIQISSAYYKN